MATNDGLSGEQLRELVVSQQRTITMLSENVERLTAQVAELKRLLFGKSSERLGPNRTMPPIDVVPAQFVRKRHVRQKVKCRSCERIVTAPAPQRVDDGCLWGPGLHAHTVVSKVADALPLYRLAKKFKRDGMPIERSTLERLYHRTAELLSPIARRILELIAKIERVNADETPVFVQAPEKCRQGYMWTFLADGLIGFVFSARRSGDTPKRILGGSTGTLQVDAFTGYNAVTAPEGRRRVGCLAHVRRKFFNALDTAPDDAKTALDGILSLSTRSSMRQPLVTSSVSMTTSPFGAN